jgi:hypothetical protein
MLVFTELIQDVFRDHWVPEAFEDEGKPVLRALKQSSDDLAKVAGRYLTAGQIAEVRTLVDDWHRDHANVVSVETVRLADFSAEAGAREAQLEGSISGLFAPAIAATIEANRAISLGERGLHYAVRSPSLLRLQGIVGLQDVLTELENALPETQAESEQLEGLLENSRDLVTEMKGLRELAPLLSETTQLMAILERNPEILARSERMIAGLSETLRQLNAILASKEPGTPGVVRAELRGLIVEICFAGIALILFAGVVYVLARLAYDRFSRARGAERRQPT